jgi:hypothetical protein
MTSEDALVISGYRLTIRHCALVINSHGGYGLLVVTTQHTYSGDPGGVLTYGQYQTPDLRCFQAVIAHET